MSTNKGEQTEPLPFGDIDEELAAQASSFLQAHTDRQNELDKIRAKRARRIQLQFWFLFAFLVVAFLVLAYRTEINSRALHDAQAIGCQRRASQAVSFNEGRTALINLVTATPANKALTAVEKAAMVKTLQDGLILPVEDCSGYFQDN